MLLYCHCVEVKRSSCVTAAGRIIWYLTKTQQRTTFKRMVDWEDLHTIFINWALRESDW